MSERFTRRHWALLSFCAATGVMIPLKAFWPGLALWLVSAVLIWRAGAEPTGAVVSAADESGSNAAGTDTVGKGSVLAMDGGRFHLRMGVLLGTVLVLGLSPINTDTSNRHFITLGLAFSAVVLGPALILGKWDPGVIRYRFWPKCFRKLDIFYVLISIPLAWGVIQLYFFHANPELPTHWILPVKPDDEAIRRVFIAINCVGIWDELFFVNTVYAVLRSMFSFRTANLAQAVLYMSVLNRMAFTGIGPIVVYLFALTQGLLFEESENLLYVLIVHLIVDAFLVVAILQFYYPGLNPGWF